MTVLPIISAFFTPLFNRTHSPLYFGEMIHTRQGARGFFLESHTIPSTKKLLLSKEVTEHVHGKVYMLAVKFWRFLLPLFWETGVGDVLLFELLCSTELYALSCHSAFEMTYYILTSRRITVKTYTNWANISTQISHRCARRNILATGSKLIFV